MIPQAFSLRFCILQAIKNWRYGRPGNEAEYNYIKPKAMQILLAITQGWTSDHDENVAIEISFCALIMHGLHGDIQWSLYM